MSNLQISRVKTMKEISTGRMGYLNEVTNQDTLLVDAPNANNSGSATFDPPNVTSGTQTTTTVNVTGAVLGDYVVASFSLSLAGMIVTAYVSAPGVVTVVFFNASGADINLNSGTLRVLVIKQ